MGVALFATSIFFNFNATAMNKGNSTATRYLLSGIFLLLSVSLYSQNSIRYSTYAEEIGDSIAVQIQLPESYERFPDQHYPVLYLLDGEFYFDYATSTIRLLSQGIQPFCPQMIVVGITSKNRFRDFTPTQPSVNNDGSPLLPPYRNSGKADRFTQFLLKNLKPRIEADYRTNDFSLLFGHSFAGLYALDLLLHQKATFSACIIADPSVWWDQERIYKESDELIAQLKQPVNLYFASANSISVPPGIDTTLMADCNQALAAKLNQQANFNIRTKHYADCSHGSVVIPALYDGLCFLFEGMSTNPKQADFTLETYLQTYKELSMRLQQPIIPQQSHLEVLVRFFLQFKHDKEKAGEYYNYWRTQYPDSPAWAKFNSHLTTTH